MLEPLLERYITLLTTHVAGPEAEHLTVAAELGRELALADVPPQDVAALHEQALRRLSQGIPQSSLAVVARRVSAPLMEMLTAYTLASHRRGEAALQRARHELDIRNKIAGILATHSGDEMYEAVLQVILEASGSEYGIYGYLDEKGALVVPSMTREVWGRCQVPAKYIVFPRELWGDSSWPRAIRERRTIYSNEPATRVPEGHIPITRHISSPILYQGESIGLFQVANKGTDYDEDDVRLLEAIAADVAPLLHARLEAAKWEKARAEMEERLRQSVRMEEISRLARGVAHDFNNLLVAIMGYASFVQESLPPDSQARADMYRILSAAEEAAAMAHQLLALQHKEVRGPPQRIAEAPQPGERDQTAALASSRETILVVDDQDMVRELASRTLEIEGYTILAARDGDEALQICRGHEGPIHLLVTDVEMPGMSGRDLAKRMASLHTKIKVLYMSGYTAETLRGQGALESGDALLTKPFTARSLARKVRKALDAPD